MECNTHRQRQRAGAGCPWQLRWVALAARSQCQTLPSPPAPVALRASRSTSSTQSSPRLRSKHPLGAFASWWFPFFTRPARCPVRRAQQTEPPIVAPQPPTRPLFFSFLSFYSPPGRPSGTHSQPPLAPPPRASVPQKRNRLRKVREPALWQFRTDAKSPAQRSANEPQCSSHLSQLSQLQNPNDSGPFCPSQVVTGLPPQTGEQGTCSPSQDKALQGLPPPTRGAPRRRPPDPPGLSSSSRSAAI